MARAAASIGVRGMGGAGAVSDVVGGIRDDAAPPPGETGRTQNPVMSLPGRSHDTDNGDACGHIAERSAERDNRVGEGAPEWQRRGQANVQAFPATVTPPRKTRRPSATAVRIAVWLCRSVAMASSTLSAILYPRNIASASSRLRAVPLSIARLARRCSRVGRRVCVHGGPQSPM